MKRNALWTYAAAFSAVRTSSCHVERADNVKHLLFKRIHIGFLGAVKLIAVEYTFPAAACRTNIAARITADAFA